jgi:protein-S-isoprenylcysteine O-methyltransferase Ste14
MSDKENNGGDNPGVVMRPPLLYGSMLVLGIGFDFLEPLAIFGPEWRMARLGLGALLLVVGAGIAIACFRRFATAGTNVPTNLPTKALVTAGPYRFSRNPIYLALTAIYLGLGLLLNNGWIFLLAIPLLVTMRYGVIAREERYLGEKFGEAYRDYCGSVRRWL